MPTTGFSHFNLRAPRAMLEELRTFYCEVVGLAVGPRPAFRSFGYWLYAGNQAVLHLSEAMADETRSARGSSTFDHAAFTCTDRHGFERVLAQHGIPFERAEVPQTGQLQLFFEDPAGNGVELNFEGPDA